MANAMLSSLIAPNATVSKRQIISVNGLTEAKNYNLERGENVILMDSGEDIIYIKSVDELGKCNLRIFSCNDITEEKLTETTSNNIGKSDVDRINKELAELKQLVKEMSNEHHVCKSKQSEKPDNGLCK
jgi:hypothetical protein